jgi:hypothetical protein
MKGIPKRSRVNLHHNIVRIVVVGELLDLCVASNLQEWYRRLLNIRAASLSAVVLNRIHHATDHSILGASAGL